MATVGMSSSETSAIDQVRELHQHALSSNNLTKFVQTLYVPHAGAFPEIRASTSPSHDPAAVKNAASRLLQAAYDELDRLPAPPELRENEITIQQQIQNLGKFFQLQTPTSTTQEPTVRTAPDAFENKRNDLLQEINRWGKDTAPKLMPFKIPATLGGIGGGAVGFAVVSCGAALVIGLTVAGSAGTFGALAAVVGLTGIGVAVGIGIVVAYRAYKRWQHAANIEKLKDLANSPLATIEQRWNGLSQSEKTIFLKHGGKSFYEQIVKKDPNIGRFWKYSDNLSPQGNMGSGEEEFSDDDEDMG